jgi:hypothetical protein
MTQQPHHTANTTTGPQLPNLRPKQLNQVLTTHQDAVGRVKRTRKRPWHRRPVLGCLKPTDLLGLALLLGTCAYVTYDLRATGRGPMPGGPIALPQVAPPAAPPQPTSRKGQGQGLTYANGLGTGP